MVDPDDLDALTPKQFRAKLADLASEFRRHIEAQVESFPTDTAAREARRARAATDFRCFAETYFPHYIRTKTDIETGEARPVEPSRFHHWLFDNLPAIVSKQRSVRQAIIAPRGEAKSTYVSLIFVLWSLLYERKHYVVVIMDSYEQAAVQVEAIKAELEYNARLAMDFPDATGQGAVWREGEAVTAHKRKIHARGSGQRLRGLKHGARRPDLVVLDDIENDENVRSPEQRDKLHRWVRQAVEHLGEAGEKLDLVYVGTILHYDSVLARTVANALWQSVKFAAVQRWPDEMGLWEQWEETLLNEGEDAADHFYRKYSQTMEAGAEVCWPDKRPLVELMKERARNGHAAFDSELQNDPLNDEDAPFRHLTYWAEANPDWALFGAVDPSLGKHGKGRDPSAILVGGLERAGARPHLDVIEASVQKRLPDRIIADMIAYQRQYPDILIWFVESVQFQEFFRTEAMSRAAREGISLPCMPVTPHADKELRIATLQPYVADGVIRVHASQATLISQLRHWPKADHDDGPDALEILWKGAVGFGGAGGGIVTRGRRGGGQPAFGGLPGGDLSDYLSM